MKILIAFIVAALLALGLFAYESNQAEKDYHQRQSEWMLFSMQHHCRVLKEPGFWEVDTTWQCDGNFQVKRNPNN